MKPHESPRIRKKSIRGDSGDSWPVWNRGIHQRVLALTMQFAYQLCIALYALLSVTQH